MNGNSLFVREAQRFISFLVLMLCLAVGGFTGKAEGAGQHVLAVATGPVSGPFYCKTEGRVIEFVISPLMMSGAIFYDSETLVLHDDPADFDDPLAVPVATVPVGISSRVLLIVEQTGPNTLSCDVRDISLMQPGDYHLFNFSSLPLRFDFDGHTVTIPSGSEGFLPGAPWRGQEGTAIPLKVYRTDTEEEEDEEEDGKLIESYTEHYRIRRYFWFIRDSSISPYINWLEHSDPHHWAMVQGIDDSVTPNVISPAAGVDTVSKTANPAAIGFQFRQAIMAPIGSSNKVRFLSQASSAFPWTINGNGSIPVPSYLTDSDALIHWWGTGTETADAFPGQSFGAIGNLYSNGIQVLMMKPRYLTVRVHPIVSEVPGRVDVGPRVVPGQTALQNYLNRIFKKQLNVHLDVLVMPPRKVAWDIATSSHYPFPFMPGVAEPVPGDGILELNGSSSSTEESVIMGHSVPGDIHVYLIGGGIFRMLVNDGGQTKLGSEPYPSGYADLTKPPGEQHVWVDGDRQGRVFDGAGNDVTTWVEPDAGKVLKIVEWIIAHEIGHLFVGAGHPDEGTGFAPLGFPPDDERHRWRLLCSGARVDHANPGRQLVAAEWDAANIIIDGRFSE